MNETTLKDDVAAKLADLLGDLQQHAGELRRGDCYCIEGALCELYRRETGHGQWILTSRSGFDSVYSFQDGDGRGLHEDTAPSRVNEWACRAAQFGPSRGSLERDGYYVDLLDLNDGSGREAPWSFADFQKVLR